VHIPDGLVCFGQLFAESAASAIRMPFSVLVVIFRFREGIDIWFSDYLYKMCNCSRVSTIKVINSTWDQI
jgi:hypothetical protein